MNPNNPPLLTSSLNSQAWFRLLCHTASRVGKLATCILLLLGVATLSQTASAQNYGTDAYSIAVLAQNPVAFWQLNEDGDGQGHPATTTAADSSGHGFNATFDTGSDCGYLNAQISPQPSGTYLHSTPWDDFYSGFTNLQGALLTGPASSAVTIPPLGPTPAALYPLGLLSTNANGTTNVDTSIVMWIKPTGTPPANAGLLFDRGVGIAGVGFETGQSGGSTELGFNWNNNWWSNGGYWHSGLYPQVNIWSFVTLVVVSNQATMYMYYMDTNGQPQFQSGSQVSYSYSPVPWNEGTIELGGDSGGAIFAGNIAGAAIFNKALTSQQVLTLFAGGVGTNGFAPQVVAQPPPGYIFPGMKKISIGATVVGTEPLAYQWQHAGTNLVNNANFLNVNSSVLTVTNVVVASDEGSYQVIVTNVWGATTSSVSVLSLTVPNLVGHWLTNATLADMSGYQAAGKHDGYVVGGANNAFSTDVPTGMSGQSLVLSGNTAIAISNSSTWDPGYTNTFDTLINGAVTVMCWAKGTPGTWLPWVSKFGENPGWQLRESGNSGYACWTMRDNNGGNLVLGSAGFANDDMTSVFSTAGNNWHLYAGTYDAATGERDLYVDGQLAAQETNTAPYFLAPAEHVVIGGRDSPPGNSFGGYLSASIYDVRIYNYALTEAQIQAVYGIQPPVIGIQPSSLSSWTNVTAQFSVVGSGSVPLSYQWQLNGTNIQLLADSANFTGANSNTLTILNTSTNDQGSYQLILTNLYGRVVSSNAVLSIVPKALVGRWFAGNTNFNDVSGYTPGGIHDGYTVGGSTYSFSTDVPAYRTGYSLYLSGGNTAIAISNSASGDVGYTNTFDDSALSISFWAKGWAGGGNWTQWASKGGDNGTGYEVGQEGWSRYYMTQFQGSDKGGISYTVGDGLWGNTIVEAPNYPDTVGFWHHYVVVFSAANRIRDMWYDGKLVADQHGASMYNSAALFHLVIGATDGHATTGVPNTYDEWATSWIYDVRFYNYNITSNDVQQLFGIPDGTPAQFTTQPPTNITTSCQGITIHIDAPNGGSPPMTNQWQVNGVNVVDGTLSDGAIIIGSKTAHLVIENVTTNEQGVYALVAGNAVATVVSTNVNLVVGALATAPAPAGNLVGRWFAGSNTLADVSGYSPAGIHNGYAVGNTHYVWDTDVPPGKTGKSLNFNVGDTGIAILNSATIDGATYTNTFDDNLTNGFTVTVWAKGIMPGWNSWVSKRGDTTGWFIRINNNNMPTWDLPASSGLAANNSDVNAEWHQYAGVYQPNVAVTNVTYDTNTLIYTTNVVVGIRRALYMDGVLLRQVDGTAVYPAATAYHVVIGGEEGGWWGASAGSFSKWKAYDVSIYNTALNVNQINSTMVATVTTPTTPVFSGGTPVVTTGAHGPQFTLTYSGTLLSATNVAGPFLPVAGATSPYTVIVSNAPDMFFELSNP